MDSTQYWDYELMGDAECQLGEPAEAHSYYERAIELGSESNRVRRAVEHIVEYGVCPP